MAAEYEIEEGVKNLKAEVETGDGNIVTKEKMVSAAKQLLQPEFQPILQALLKILPNYEDMLVRHLLSFPIIVLQWQSFIFLTSIQLDFQVQNKVK